VEGIHRVGHGLQAKSVANGSQVHQALAIARNRVGLDFLIYLHGVKHTVALKTDSAAAHGSAWKRIN